MDRIRHFERFWETRLRRAQRAVRMEHFTEADIRVLHELGLVEGGRSGAWLAGWLGFDAGYMSRTLKKLESCSLVEPVPAARDRRLREWELTPSGRRLSRRIEERHRQRVRAEWMPPSDHERLVAAMRVIEEILTNWR